MGTRQQIQAAPSIEEVNGILNGAMKVKTLASKQTKSAWRNTAKKRIKELRCAS